MKWLLYGSIVLFTFTGCTRNWEEKAEAGAVGAASGKSSTADESEQDLEECRDQLKELGGVSPTEALKSDEITDECKEALDLQGFSDAYEDLLKKCASELKNVGSENVLAYLGKNRSKASKTCRKAMEAVRKYLPPPPDSGGPR